ncbi:MAG: methyltransferase domain-containing protein [Candidatus Thorarchaeota archaeon]|nr:MAG: methyltransferase domain-containing protein [Candidatus Thorarchaeota archaeon]
MTEYVFILGKNWLLSIAELLVHLEDLGLEVRIADHSRNAVVVKVDQVLDNGQLVDIQSALGGCFKTGRVITRYDKEIAEKAFPVRGKIGKDARRILQSCPWVSEVWGKPKNKKIKFGVSTYPMVDDAPRLDLKRFTLGMDEWIKQKLTELEAKKAVYYAYDEPDKRDEKRPNTALWPATIARHKLLSPPNAEILAIFTEDTLYIGRTVVVYDSQLQQYRDESRPYVSAEISTSPKLCRTLLNLAGARTGDVVLDPFCGTGTILMEAAMLDMKCIGIDNNAEAVRGARSNLKWLSIELDQVIDYTIIRGDSRHASDLVNAAVDAVAFEPDLGPIYSDTPDRSEAECNIKSLTDLYNSVLQSVAQLLNHGGRIGMTVPVINSSEGQVTVDLSAMIDQTGLEVREMLPEEQVSGSATTHRRMAIRPGRRTLPERKRGQIVQRLLLMLERL